MSPSASTADNAAKGPPPTAPLAKYDEKTYAIASEGSAEILDLHRPEDAASHGKGASKPQSVFYNPIQQYNRDLSVLAIKAFGEDYVAVQQAKRQKKVNKPTKDGQQGRKRKRAQTDGGEDENEDRRKVVARTGDTETSVTVDSDRVELKASAAIANDAAVVPESVEAQKAEPKANGHHTSSGPSAENGARDQGDAVQANGALEGLQTTETSHTASKPIPFRILDALSATGLRALRYAREIATVTSVTANDLSASATDSIKLNVSHNELGDKIIPITGDAIDHMHAAASSTPGSPNLYHVIDLDPYGTAGPFLDAAVRAVVDGGLLCVTCTDAGVFASVGYLEKTFSQYGGLPVKGAHAHEAGLRLILHAIAMSAARYGLAIEPLLSLSIDFYARLFVRVHRAPAEVKFLASKTMLVYNCDSGCGAWAIQHLARAKAKTAKNGDTFYNFTSAIAPSTGTRCEHCGFKTHLAGPMWGGPLHNPHFIQRVLDMLPTLDKDVYGTIPRIEGMLSIALNETLADQPAGSSSSETSSPDRPVPTMHPATLSHHPFFFLPSALSRIIHCVSPSDAAIRGALIHLSYRATRSHTKAGSICTDAPWDVIWEVMREWARQKSPIKEGAIKNNTAGWAIMQKDRSKRKLNEVKESFKKAADNGELDDVGDLRTHMEAALYRLSRDQEGGRTSTEQEDGSVMDETQNEERESPTTKAPEAKHPSKLKIVFDEALGREVQSKRMVNYQINPRPDWGPMNRAKGA